MKRLVKLLVNFYRENAKIVTIYAIVIFILLTVFICLGITEISRIAKHVSAKYDINNIIDK